MKQNDKDKKWYVNLFLINIQEQINSQQRMTRKSKNEFILKSLDKIKFDYFINNFYLKVFLISVTRESANNTFTV